MASLARRDFATRKKTIPQSQNALDARDHLIRDLEVGIIDFLKLSPRMAKAPVLAGTVTAATAAAAADAAAFVVVVADDVETNVLPIFIY